MNFPFSVEVTSLDHVQLNPSSPYLIRAFLDKISNCLENYEYAFHRLHIVLTEFRGNVFGELSGDDGGLKTSKPNPPRKQNQNNVVHTVETCSFTCLRERQGDNFQSFFSISINLLIFSHLQLMS